MFAQKQHVIFSRISFVLASPRLNDTPEFPSTEHVLAAGLRLITLIYTGSVQYGYEKIILMLLASPRR